MISGSGCIGYGVAESTPREICAIRTVVSMSDAQAVNTGHEELDLAPVLIGERSTPAGAIGRAKWALESPSERRYCSALHTAAWVSAVNAACGVSKNI